MCRELKITQHTDQSENKLNGGAAQYLPNSWICFAGGESFLYCKPIKKAYFEIGLPVVRFQPEA